MGAFDHLGPALSRLRHDRGLLQREVARRADLTKSMISHYEREVSRPSLASLEKILDALGADLVDLHRAMTELRRLDAGGGPDQAGAVSGAEPRHPSPVETPGPDPVVQEILGLLARAFEEASERARRDREPRNAPDR